jgi:hypothetical protein
LLLILHPVAKLLVLHPVAKLLVLHPVAKLEMAIWMMAIWMMSYPIGVPLLLTKSKRTRTWCCGHNEGDTIELHRIEFVISKAGCPQGPPSKNFTAPDDEASRRLKREEVQGRAVHRPQHRQAK